MRKTVTQLDPVSVVVARRHRHVSNTTLAAALLLAALLPLLLLPASSRAADNVYLKVETNVIPGRATLSTADVKTYIAYQVAFTNDNTSTLTQTRLRIGKPSITGSSATATFVEAYPTGQARDCVAGTGGVAVDCDFGQLKPDKSIALTFIFRLPLHGTVTLPAELVFAKKDTYVTVNEGTSDGPPAANADTFSATNDQTVHLVSVPEDAGGTNLDYFATYTPAFGGTWGTNGTNIQRDTEQLGPGNSQATKVVVPATNDGTITILKELAPGGNFECPEPGECFGDVSELTVPGIGTKTIIVFLRWDSSALPSGMTPRKLRVAWDADDGGPLPAQIVSTACNQSASNAPCRYATEKFSDKDLGVMLVLPHNGRLRGM